MGINKSYESLVFAFFMGLGMSFFMSFIMTLINVGMNRVFFKIWMGNWGIGSIVAVPVSLILPPFISRLVKMVVEK